MSRSILIGILVAIAGFMGAAYGEPSKSYQRTHALHSLDPRVAESLAWEICSAIGSTERDPCKVVEATTDNLFVLGTDEVHAAIVKMLAERDPAVRSAQRFEVLLVRSVERPAGRELSSFPEHIASALSGVRELMPEARFEAIGSGWLRTTDRGRIRIPGPDGTRYLIDIEYRGRRVGLDRTELILAIEVSRDSNNPNLRDMLATSLSVFVGETVVVASSTSRKSDDPFVFLLLTAED